MDDKKLEESIKRFETKMVKASHLLTKMHTILKLQEVVKMGYVPSRGRYSYFHFVHGYQTRQLANCFEHACFNLTDQQLDDLKFDAQDLVSFSQFPEPNKEGFEVVEEELVTMIKATGLEVQKCSLTAEIDRTCEWRIALYFSEIEDDFHFMLQERDGGWSSKAGSQAILNVYPYLPSIHDESYRLYDIKKITNPYAKQLLIDKEK